MLLLEHPIRTNVENPKSERGRANTMRIRGGSAKSCHEIECFGIEDRSAPYFHS